MYVGGVSCGIFSYYVHRRGNYRALCHALSTKGASKRALAQPSFEHEFCLPMAQSWTVTALTDAWTLGKTNIEKNPPSVLFHCGFLTVDSQIGDSVRFVFNCCLRQQLRYLQLSLVTSSTLITYGTNQAIPALIKSEKAKSIFASCG